MQKLESNLTYIFKVSALGLKICVLLYLWFCIKLPQIFHEVSEMVSLLFVHDKARDAKLIVDQFGRRIAQISIGSPHRDKDLSLGLEMTLVHLCILLTDDDLVRMDIPRQLTVLALNLLLCRIRRHIQDTIQVYIDS
jgi:hypothetical protein